MLLIINLYVASINSRSVSEACILLPSYIPFWGHRCNLEQQGCVASGLGRKWLLQGWQGETGAGGAVKHGIKTRVTLRLPTYEFTGT